MEISEIIEHIALKVTRERGNDRYLSAGKNSQKKCKWPLLSIYNNIQCKISYYDYMQCKKLRSENIRTAVLQWIFIGLLQSMANCNNFLITYYNTKNIVMQFARDFFYLNWTSCICCKGICPDIATTQRPAPLQTWNQSRHGCCHCWDAARYTNLQCCFQCRRCNQEVLRWAKAGRLGSCTRRMQASLYYYQRAAASAL